MDVQCHVACEQALLFGRVKRVSRERASEWRLATHASLAQTGELARRLDVMLQATTLTRKCDISRWFPSGADEWTGRWADV